MLSRLVLRCMTTSIRRALIQSPATTQRRQFSATFRILNAQTTEGTAEKETLEQRKEKLKILQTKVIGGALLFIFVATHAMLLWRRRQEYRRLNKEVPPIRFEEFLDDYYSKGQVKEIVYQPQFEIANVYLYKNQTNEPKNWLAQRMNVSDHHARQPDIRVDCTGATKDIFTTEMEELKQKYKDVYAQHPNVVFDTFPSYG
ncbi:hypothetical protein WR25_06447 isoform B [Diploscapter pachys]|uniref:Uncharacterized protein n=1 Tax=Diploscapter pachys TaxID=2018661 RepID=A0A2A2K971_9BILA|nr:hypothetical protein WR25_06447 isoform B [Diploscapter pachys]